MTFSMDDYVDVAQRIAEFYDRFPEGSLRSGSDPRILEAGGKTFIVYHAQAWRTPDDSCPSDGWAWEPIPGPTPYTKDSELMNAETSAWGRAIVALGFATKKIASAQEVRNRRQPGKPPVEPGTVGPLPSAVGSGSPPELSALTALVDELIAAGDINAEQVAAAAKLDLPWPALADSLSPAQVADLLARLRKYAANKTAA